ncbi:MAG TPA: flagellar filament capping protein FliD [Verrucomicrobiae bacterium]|nr:flagellar filament capping protein FliD [Verrucomicrobiae bacterium]
MASSSGVNLAISGLASGFDWQSLVTQLAQAERSPETGWQANQTKINNQNSAWTIIKSYLGQLQSNVDSLKNPTIYNNRTATSSAPSVATATSASGGMTGTFSFSISQLASAASLTGTGNISAPISATNDVSTLTVGAANFATAVTAGSFTVNGAQVTVATTDSMKAVFDKIAAATSNAVTASYDTTTDKITLSSSSAIKLGSAADTSNFLQVAKLYNNNTGTITSGDTLGRVNTGEDLSNVGLATAISDGGSGAGQFNVNGVAISYNASTDTVQNVLDRINSSAAGVTASYDVVNNRFAIANNTTGDVGISLQDVTGNFLTATGLAGGTLNSGTNLKYTVNNGPALVSQSNTIDSSSSGIAGLSVTALATNSATNPTTITVGSDTSALSTAVQSFVTNYNNVQSYITTNAASTTDSTGAVTAGTLTGDVDAGNLATSLRTSIFSSVSITGLSAGFSQLANLGITSNGQNNTVTLDSSALSNALSSNLGDIQKLFSDPTNGLGVQLDTFLTNTIGDSGTITNHQAALTTQSKSIDTQIANQEKTIATDSAHWTTEFQNMETAQAQLQQELTALNQQVANGTL